MLDAIEQLRALPAEEKRQLEMTAFDNLPASLREIIRTYPVGKANTVAAECYLALQADVPIDHIETKLREYRS